MSDKNKVNKKRDECKHHSQDTKQFNDCVQLYMVVFLKESDTIQSLGKPDKIKFLNGPKQNELAKINIDVVSSSCRATYL